VIKLIVKMLSDYVTITVIFIVALFLLLTFTFGLEWAFTDIEYNRFYRWAEGGAKHKAQFFYLCAILGAVSSAILYKAGFYD